MQVEHVTLVLQDPPAAFAAGFASRAQLLLLCVPCLQREPNPQSS
jgi:hypothetical protein